VHAVAAKGGMSPRKKRGVRGRNKKTVPRCTKMYLTCSVKCAEKDEQADRGREMGKSGEKANDERGVFDKQAG